MSPHVNLAALIAPPSMKSVIALADAAPCEAKSAGGDTERRR